MKIPFLLPYTKIRHLLCEMLNITHHQHMRGDIPYRFDVVSKFSYHIQLVNFRMYDIQVAYIKISDLESIVSVCVDSSCVIQRIASADLLLHTTPIYT